MLERDYVIPGSKHDIIKGWLRNSFRIRNASRILPRSKLLWRMAVGVQKKRIVPAMIMSFKFQKLCTSSMGARQTQREHCGFASSIGEAYSLGGQHHAPEALGRFHFGRSR